MNDELTPDERAAMRARILGGARDITPAGAHRKAWIAGIVAVALVVAIAGGVVATSTLSSPVIATTPSPSPTVSSEPTPSPSPTPTPSATNGALPPTVAFDGECAAVLSDDAVSSIVGTPMILSNGVSAQDAGVLGGVTCQWIAAGDGYQAVGISVFRWEVVPDAVRSQIGVIPDCAVDGYSCEYAQRFGDAAVLVWASRTDDLTALADAVGDRAALSPGSAGSLPPDAWTVPECSVVRDALDRERGRSDIVDHRGDYYPRGYGWEVMSGNGAAAYCAVDNLSAPEGAATVVDVVFGPGALPDLEEIDRRGGVPAAVAGADAAWYLPRFTSSSALLVVQSGRNTVTVGTQSMTEDEMVRAAATVIAVLG